MIGASKARRRVTCAAAVVALGALAACSAATQTTSGRDYLAAQPEWAARNAGPVTTSVSARAGSSVDRAVYDAANTEPTLRFPARIGLARLANGGLTAVPAVEADHWIELIRARGAAYGEFVPVSPLVVQLTADSLGPDRVRTAVDRIRVGAARQHLDAVLVYEVTGNSRDSATALSVLDLTIVGNYLIPSRSLRGTATASAILIDVRNGYPYATVTAQAAEDGIWTNSGSTERSRELTGRAQTEAVRKLTVEVGTTIERLRTELERRELDRLRAAAAVAPPARPPGRRS